MTTVTIAEIRVFCNMESNYPTDATLTQWISDVGAIITQYKSDVADAISNIVIKNRISKLFMATRNQGITNGGMQADMAGFTPLTMEEMTLLSGYETNVDSISMNGKRVSETSWGRR